MEAPRNTETERDPLKVATFNINNINKRLDNLLAWLAKAEPDVVSLQELKARCPRFAPHHITSAVFTSLVLGR
ncbi:MAG: endonuclease/exonuclease/phosphatase family protein [Terriglobales bacterium]